MLLNRGEWHRLAAAALATAIIAFSGADARAEVRVSGDVKAVSIEASQSKVSEILLALGREYDVVYRTSVPLDADIAGSFSGSLSEVLARVLGGYNFMIRKAGTTTEVVVIGRHGDRAVVGAEAATPARSLASQWRSSREELVKSQKSDAPPAQKAGK